MNTPPSSSINACQSLVMSPKRKLPSNDVRPFQCKVPGCYQRFKRKFTLAEHTKTHTGERPFVCPVATCGKTFSTSGNLSRHKTLHPWLKSLTCLVEGCGRSFSNDVSLERHLLTHFKGPRSLPVCPVANCGKTFSTMGSLTRHTKQQHHSSAKTQYSRESNGSAVALCESRRNPAGTRFSPLSGEESVVISDEELCEFLQDIFAEDAL